MSKDKYASELKKKKDIKNEESLIYSFWDTCWLIFVERFRECLIEFNAIISLQKKI